MFRSDGCGRRSGVGTRIAEHQSRVELAFAVVLPRWPQIWRFARQGPTLSKTYEVIEFTLLHANNEGGKFMSCVLEDAPIAVL